MSINTVVRSNPLNDIPAQLINRALSDIESISLIYSEDNKVLSNFVLDTEQNIISFTEQENGFEVKVNQNTDFFNEYLIDRNFYFKIYFNNGEVDHLFYSIKPSAVFLDSINVDSTAGATGNIASNGDCELWKDSNNAYFTTALKRVYYNSYIANDFENSSDGYTELYNKILDAIENGGGRCEIDNNVTITNENQLVINTSGISISTNQEININNGSITYVGCDCSCIVYLAKFNNIGNTAEIKLINSSLLFENCEFRNIKFSFLKNSKAKFNNCKFHDCSFEGEENNLATKINLSNSTVYRTTFNNIGILNNYQAGFEECLFTNIYKSTFLTCAFVGNAQNSINRIDTKISHFENCAFRSQSFTITTSHYTKIVKCFSKQYFENYAGELIETQVSIILDKDFGTYDNIDNKASELVIGYSTFNKLNIKKDSNNKNQVDVNIFNCTTLNPILTTNINKDLDSVVGIFNTAYVSTAKTSKFASYTAAINCLELKYNTKDSDNGLGSYVNRITDTTPLSLIVFSSETTQYKHLNGTIKCLRYSIKNRGIDKDTAIKELSLDELAVNSINKYFTNFDIFNNPRSLDMPTSGCEEYEAAAGWGGKINLNYTTTYEGIKTFKTDLSEYQSPIIVLERNDYTGNEYVPEFNWYFDNVQLIPESVENKEDWSTRCRYFIKNIQKFTPDSITLKVECVYFSIIIENEIALRISEVPTLIYDNLEETSWTNTYFNTSVKLHHNNITPEETYSVFDATWYIVNDRNIASKFSTTSTYYDINKQSIFADLVISPVEKLNGGKYFCSIYYKPNGFEIGRNITSSERINLIVKNNIIIDESLTTNGIFKLNVEDVLLLQSALIQGDDPWFEWQINTSSDLNDEKWVTIFGPTKQLLEYKVPMYSVNYTGIYYRFHAWNYKDANSTPTSQNAEIATEAYSNSVCFVTVFPKQLQGDEINSNIVLFKIATKNLTSPASVIDVNNNYRVFSSLDNKDYGINNEKLKSLPILHRRDYHELWEYNYNYKTAEKLYEAYRFPTDIDIDKYNLSFGVATEEYIDDTLDNIDSTTHGGKLYVLNLETLNDNKKLRINKPILSVDLIDEYNKISDIDDNIQWKNLGKLVFARNNYIAVSDPTASIIRSNNKSEFDTFINPRLYSNNNRCVWTVKLNTEYLDNQTPFIQLYDYNKHTGAATQAMAAIKYDSSLNQITINFDNNESYSVAPGIFKLNVIGRKLDLVNDDIEHVEHTTVYCPKLNASSWDRDGKETEDGKEHDMRGRKFFHFEIQVPETYIEQPLVQLYDSNGNIINADISYTENVHFENGKKYFDRRFTAKILADTTTLAVKEELNLVLNKNTVYAVLVGKNKNNISSNKIVTKKVICPYLKYINGITEPNNANETDNTIYNKYNKWEIQVDPRLDDIGYVQIFSNTKNSQNFEITDIKFNKFNNLVTIYFEYTKYYIKERSDATQVFDENINEGDFSAVIFGEQYNESLREKYTTVLQNTGRVLLFKYDGNAESIELVKVIKCPNPHNDTYFGEAVEFDDHGNILISATGASAKNEVCYYEKPDFSIAPTIGTDDKLGFNTLGKVYVFNIEKLISLGVGTDSPPDQELSTNSIFKSINYNYGSWGELSKFYNIQPLFFIKDKKTNGAKTNETFTNFEEYYRYYDFSYEYDPVFKKQFPSKYTVGDFYRGNSKNDFYTIGYKQIYSTININERFGTAISYNNDNLIIGAPYYNNNQGLVEVWRWNELTKKYLYTSYTINPYTNNESLYGINVEMASDYALVTFKQTALKQAVSLLKYTDNRLQNINATVLPFMALKSYSFGNSLDSYDYTFAIASPNESKIYRYEFNKNTNRIKVIQVINLEQFGIAPNNATNIAITKNKILCGFNSYGTYNSNWIKEHIVNETNGNEGNLVLNNTGEGGILQFNLIGGGFKL